MSTLKRVFVIDGKFVEDQYPGFTVEQAKKMMVDQYPNILNASFTQDLDEVNGVLKIVFSSQVIGTRG